MATDSAGATKDELERVLSVSTNEEDRTSVISSKSQVKDDKSNVNRKYKLGFYLCRVLIISIIGFACGILSYLQYKDLGRSVGITSFVMCCTMLIMIIYDSAIEERKRAQIDRKETTCLDNLKFIGQTSWNKKALYFPLITHFADMSSDIAVIIEFYTLSLSNTNDYDINYFNLFIVSLSTFFLYRIITSILYLFFSRNKFDFFLQLFDLMIFKIVHKSWELGLNEVSWIQQYVSLLESLFESSIQALISIYVILKTGITNVSLIIIISQLLSLISISNAQIKEDMEWFTPQSNAKQIEFKCVYKCWKKKYYTNSRILCCNYRFLLRVLWRYIDTSLRIILCGMIWIHFSGLFLMLSFLFEAILFVFVGNYVASKSDKWTTNLEDRIELYLFAGLLSLLPNSNDCTGSSYHSGIGAIYSWYRHIWNIIWVIIAVQNEWENSIVSYVICVLCVLNLLLYINFASRRMFGCGNASNRCKPWKRDPLLGFNWTHYELSTTRNLNGCRTLKQVQTLIGFGMNFHEDSLKNAAFWERCLEPLQLLKHFEKMGANLKVLEYDNGTILQWFGKNRYFTQHKQVQILENGDKKEWEIQDYCDELVSYLVNDLEYNTSHDFWGVLEDTAWYQTNEYLLQSLIKNDVQLSRPYHDDEYAYEPGIKWHIDHNTTAKMEQKQIMREIIVQNFDPVVIANK